jgi:hypothetical protein
MLKKSIANAKNCGEYANTRQYAQDVLYFVCKCVGAFAENDMGAAQFVARYGEVTASLV